MPLTNEDSTSWRVAFAAAIRHGQCAECALRPDHVDRAILISVHSDEVIIELERHPDLMQRSWSNISLGMLLVTQVFSLSITTGVLNLAGERVGEATVDWPAVFSSVCGEHYLEERVLFRAWIEKVNGVGVLEEWLRPTAQRLALTLVFNRRIRGDQALALQNEASNQILSRLVSRHRAVIDLDWNPYPTWRRHALEIASLYLYRLWWINTDIDQLIGFVVLWYRDSFAHTLPWYLTDNESGSVSSRVAERWITFQVRQLRQRFDQLPSGDALIDWVAEQELQRQKELESPDSLVKGLNFAEIQNEDEMHLLSNHWCEACLDQGWSLKNHGPMPGSLLTIEDRVRNRICDLFWSKIRARYVVLRQFYRR